MNHDDFTEITHENWLSRLGDSIKGILLGIILFIAAFPLLWWNEGRSVERYHSLTEGLNLVISVPADHVNPAHQDKLVHIQGTANTNEILQDSIFGVSATALKLIRQVSMYQWQEHKKTETIEKIGGTQETRTTYSYTKAWSFTEIHSNQFKRSGHENPTFSFPKKTWQAKKVTLGKFTLNHSQINRINHAVPLALSQMNPPESLAHHKLTLINNEFYLGTQATSPEIGDMKISFQMIHPSEISLVAQQQGNHFIAYQTQAGSPIDLLKLGLMDAQTLFDFAQQENTLLTWGLRLGGILIMWIGLSMIFKPLSIVGSVVPFIGHLISMGTKILAFLITLPCAMITIALAWIAYRPLLALGLISVAILAIVIMKFMLRQSVSTEVNS